MSTLKVNKIEHTSTTAGGVSIDSSGNVTLPANTKVGTQNLPSAGPLSNRNLIINGAMQVAQRGTSSTSSDWRTVDRFYYNFGGGLAGTQSQQPLSSGTPYNEGFRNFYRFAISTASTAAGTYCQLIHPIEAQNLANSGWQYASANSDVTVSFWVRSSVAQTFYGQLVSKDGTSQNYIFSFALSADTWTKVTKTVPGNTNVTINNDNGNGLELIIVPFFGTNLTDAGATVDAWQAYSGSSRVPDMTSTWANTTSATFDVTGVQLEVGSVATPFEHRSYGDELARCQRYFYKWERENGQGQLGQVQVYSTTQAWGRLLVFPVRMRAAPTFSSNGTFRFFNNTLSTGYDVTWSTTYLGPTQFGALVSGGSSLSAGNCSGVYANADGDYLHFNAEL